MHICLMVDFGSTYTKVTAFDIEKNEFLGRAQSPTTVTTDVSIGLEKALRILEQEYGIHESDIKERYACSSAAGGLRMAAVGLVPALTLEAANRAALSAGAKVVGSFGFEIDEEMTAEIEALSCDIIMLCGGTDGGNKNVILHNAGMLSRSGLNCPILVCGNRSVTGKVKAILEEGGKRVYTAPNVLPEVNRLETAPAQAMIREIFIEHIVKAKGLDKVSSYFDAPVIPTPFASIRAAELLADGTDSVEGIGSLLVVEVGGATTNIHSVEANKPVSSQTVMRGLPDDKVSRTVEGDLGIRYNARQIYLFAGEEKLNQIAKMMDPSVDESLIDTDAYIKKLERSVEYVPQNQAEYAMDAALAAAAVDIAVERHVGSIHTEYSPTGDLVVQNGKNLMNVKNILGTGGIFKYGKMQEKVLKAALFNEQTSWSLKPVRPRPWLDADYLMYAVGLLSQNHPEEALIIAKDHLKALSFD